MGLILICWLGLLLFIPAQLAHADTPPVCFQPPLTSSLTVQDQQDLNYRVYLPVVFKPVSGPPCTVYCGLLLEDDPFRPAGYQTYFADEFDCDRLLAYWVVQASMSPASYKPPESGYYRVADGILQVGVPALEPSFPYLYIVDDSASSYDVPHTATRVDWLPDSEDFIVAMRIRFDVDELGEHRIAVYADGHRPGYAGPLFYIGTDFNAEQEAWRGLIAGADRGQSFVDLGERGYSDPYTGWVVVTANFNYSADSFTLSIDGTPVIVKPLSSFKGYPEASIRPDVLYVGSLALLEEAAPWTDIELDWLRVYSRDSTPAAEYGLLTAATEQPPAPTDPASLYSAMLPTGPFANTPHWAEEFDTPDLMPDDWHQVADPDPANSWTIVADSRAKLENNGHAAGVPVWAVFDDVLPIDILAAGIEAGQEGRESPADYLRRRGGSPFSDATGQLAVSAVYTRTDWRPDHGNIRYAWRGFQSADGYGVEISNGGHGDAGDTVYFTGAMFYTLLDTTTPGGGQFIFPGCQEQYFWRLHLLPDYGVRDTWTTVVADYINGTVHLYVDGQKIGWWPESDCSLNWYLKGENATAPEVLFFGNPATARDFPSSWSEVQVDWFATFPGLPRGPLLPTSAAVTAE